MRKVAFIAIVLLMTVAQASRVFARGGGPRAEDPWNPQHIEGLPSEVRDALKRMCASPRAEHYFATYFQGSRVLVLHFEYWRCGDRGQVCTQRGCLHQVYVSSGGRYQLMRAYYGPAGD
jgi:hypothetical protein